MKRFFSKLYQTIFVSVPVSKPLIYSLIGIFLAAAGISAFLIFRPIPISEAYSFSLDPDSVRIAEGDSHQIESLFSVIDEKKAEKTKDKLEALSLTWSSSDESVATVDEKGCVTGISRGTALITASFEKITAVCEVNVYIPLKNLSFEQKEITCKAGDQIPLALRKDPAEAEFPDEVTYHSTAPSVAKVDSKGTLIAYYPGEATITVHTGGLEASCHVTVTAPLESISLNKDSLDLTGNETFQLSCSFYPNFTTDPKDIVWTSSDEAVATVDENGLVTSKNAGDAVITAQAGSHTASCQVHVTIPMTGIAFSFNTLTIRNGDSVALPLSYIPYNTSDDKTTKWTSSNENVLKVNETGKVTAVGPGTAAITAVCNDFKVSCQITVIIPVTGVNISASSLTLNKGAGASLSASVVPGNTTESPYISWSSDDTSVITVNNGAVTAVGPGTATIYASHDNYSATCTVTVLSPMTGISFDQQSLQLIEGSQAPLSINVIPSDTTDNRNASWSSDNPSVATVTEGVVTGVSAGSCHIIANVNGFTASAEVTVIPFVPVESITLNTNSLTFGSMGETASLSAVIAPANATITSPSWSSSNTNVAKVNGSGLVTAVGSGTATITASVGDKSASCSVTVAAANKIVVLDPGHGSTLTGAYYNGQMEHKMTLVVANACKSYLEQNYSGVTVYLTRSTEANLVPSNLKADLEARAQYAQDVNADILVSMHFNATASHNASGALAFVSKQANVSAASDALARSILSRICGATGLLNRGPITGNSNSYFDEFGNPLDYYAINRHCANRGIPGIIVEHCFMDVDTQFCDTNDKLVQFGIWDAQGIAAYLGLPAK